MWAKRRPSAVKSFMDRSGLTQRIKQGGHKYKPENRHWLWKHLPSLCFQVLQAPSRRTAINNGKGHGSFVSREHQDIIKHLRKTKTTKGTKLLLQMDKKWLLYFNRPYGTLWFGVLKTGNELPAYWRLPLRGIYSRSECFSVFFCNYSAYFQIQPLLASKNRQFSAK